ncbi:AAA family ATPase [Flectobacillus longus]|uniref:AAA family ATPase n=1 Tax=Flectobacillus longus TaxID=2984207 RepID=UPI0024B6F962|nr:AAA family ATPase [Flectobacillus longus]MDI9879996.1 AAA family ATPase [Flectobacillus longus]
MIKKITIQNFFSFGNEQTIELNADTNVLVGINGTGKSNFIKAIRLLCEIALGDFEKLFSEKWGGFSSVMNFINPDVDEIAITYEFDKDFLKKNFQGYFLFHANPIYQVKIHKKGEAGYSLSEWIYNESTKKGVSSPFTYLKVEKGNNGLISEKGAKESKIKRLELLKSNESVFKQINDPDRYFPIYTLKKAIEQIDLYSYFDTTFESPIRRLSSYFSEDKLFPDGKNLTSLLSSLNSTSVRAYDKIIEEFKNVNPNFRELVFTTPVAGKSLLSLKEKNLDKTISIEHISDGTLRYLLLLSIFYNPKRGSVVCIDEPETGLHPDMIYGIARGIKYAAQNGTQMIIATHSPLLLNDFILEDLMIFEKDKINQSIVKTISEDEFPSSEGNFLVGQMWLRGQIGGKRW